MLVVDEGVDLAHDIFLSFGIEDGSLFGDQSIHFRVLKA